MKLFDILVNLPPEQLEQLSRQHVHSEEPLPKVLLCQTIDGNVRSFRFMQDFIFTRQPPTFAILTALLEAPGSALPEVGFREAVEIETDRICRLINEGEILHRDNGIRLYRRVLSEARRNGIQIDASESALLAVLRRELGIHHVEHFLIEHHTDLHEFWRCDDCFVREVHELRAAGLLFTIGASFLLPEDVLPLVRQVLGIDMTKTCVMRLYSHLANSELTEALELVNAKTSGSKEDRIERLVLHMVQPRAVLRRLSLDSLRTICRDVRAMTSGSKDELVERIIAHFAAELDTAPPEALPEPSPEVRSLDEQRFVALFSSLKGNELTDILEAFPELRRSGSKCARAETLWASRRSEATLLRELSNRQLEEVLVRFGLKTSGSKDERIDRIIDYFASMTPETFLAAADAFSSDDVQATDRAETFAPASSSTKSDD